MKKYLFLIFALLAFCGADALAEIVYNSDNTISSFDDTNITIGQNVEISAATTAGILMSNGVNLHNNGTINGVINTNGNSLNIYNTTDNATINVTGGGNVTQIISAENEITHINVVGSGYAVSIDGVSSVNFSDIQTMGADSFTVTATRIIIDDYNDWQTSLDLNISLEDNVVLVVNDENTVRSGDVIAHTVSEDTVNVEVPNLDNMYKIKREKANGGIVLYIVRETNYSKVFEDSEPIERKRNSALDLIREDNPHDKLLMALDKAKNMTEFNHLKSLSYRFNHDILLRPVKMQNKFMWMNFIKNEKESGVGIEPYYVMSDKINVMGGHVYSGYKFDNIYLGAGVNIGRFDYKDKLNDFSGMFYGFDINSKQTFDKFWLGEAFALSMTNFKADYISEQGDIKKNPSALSWYGDVMAGYDFKFERDITLSPVVGFAYQSYKVADVSDTDSFVHGGANAKYFFAMDGIKYEYSLSGSIGTNGDMFANFGIGFVSVTDDFGVSLNTGVLKDEFDYYYAFSLNAKVMF